MVSKSFLNQGFILVVFILFSTSVSSQSKEKIVSDSIKFSPIELTDIPLRSAETLMRTNKILKNLIISNEITKLKRNNDSILNIVEENAAFYKDGAEFRSIRYLENQSFQLKIQKEIVNKEIGQLSKIIDHLDKSIKYFADEKKIWQITKNDLLESEFSGIIVERIDLIVDSLGFAKSEVARQTEIMLFTLDRSSRIRVQIDELLENLDEVMMEQERHLLQNDHPSILKLKYSAENLVFLPAIKNYLASEWIELKSFFRSQMGSYIVIFILFSVLLYVFIHYRGVFIGYEKTATNYYKKKLSQVLSKPISISILLIILASSIIIPNRPMVFRDLSNYLLVIPMIVIMRALINKQLLFIVYGFAAIMILNIVFVIFPPENVIYRFCLILVALADIYFTWYFLFRTIKELSYTKLGMALFRVTGTLFFIMACIGLYGSLSGSVMVAQGFLSAINTVVVVGTVIYVSTITIIGLLIALIDSKEISQINFIKNYGNSLKSKIVKIFNTIAGFSIIVVLLTKLNIWELFSKGILDIFNSELSIGEFHFSLSTILIFILVIYLSIVLSNIIQVILEGDILDRMSLSKGLPHTISMMAKYSLITVGLMLAVVAAGMELSSMTVIIGAFGVGIGFGLQNIFNNLVSGLILLFERPVKIGDTIEVGTLIGNVKSIGIRSSNVLTFDGAEVIVPNGQLISNEVINWTLSSQQRRIEVVVGVSYSSNPHQVHELLLGILKKHKEIMQDPAPIVLFNELGESSLDFRLLFWTAAFGEWLRIRSEIIFEAFDILNENDIEIPFPQRDLHVRSIEQGLKIETKN